MAMDERHTLALTADGKLLVTGDDPYGQASGILKATKGRTITAIAPGASHTLALTAPPD
ncbi:hypothetical protein [Streptomyces sp. x-80]|uniref:hypothetical protein n=1 Tax=Streptomyces sp. x-80 TaxID=2789282 RepID=UPI00397F59BB